MKSRPLATNKRKIANKKRQDAKASSSSGTAASTKTIDLLATDVLLGRGKRASQYEGNRRYYKMVACYLPAYKRTSKNREKSKITQEILEKVQNQGGRFLKESGDRFVPVSDQVARTKIGQALRHQLRLQEGFRSGEEGNNENTHSERGSMREDDVAPYAIVTETSLSHRSMEADDAFCSSRSMSMRSDHMPLPPARKLVTASAVTSGAGIKIGGGGNDLTPSPPGVPSSSNVNKESDLFSSVSEMGLEEDLDEFDAISDLDEDENAHAYQALDENDTKKKAPVLILPALASLDQQQQQQRAEPAARRSSFQHQQQNVYDALKNNRKEARRPILPAQQPPKATAPTTKAPPSIIDDKDLEEIDFAGIGGGDEFSVPAHHYQQQEFWRMSPSPSS